MFIHYTGPSSEKQAGVRGAINAVVAANASLKRRRRRHDAKRDDGKQGPGDAGDALGWLNDRPLIVLQAQRQDREGAAGAREKLITETENENQGTTTETPATAHLQEDADEEFYLWDGTIQRHLGDGVTYPTPKQPYYPALLFQRQNLFLLVAHQYPRTFAHNIYNTWTQMVLSDACLFHATLFATSSLIDFVQQKRNNPVTLRHKGETIRLINQAVAQAATHGLRDEVIAVTTYLVYFSKLLGNFQEAEQHDAGITAMLDFKGGAPPAPDTYISYLLRLRDVWNSIVYRFDTLFPSLAGPPASLGCYTSLLAIAIQKQFERPLEQRLPVPLLHFLITFNNQCIGAAEYAVPNHTILQPTTPDPTADLSPEIHHAMQCISITANIYWAAVTRDLNMTMTVTMTNKPKPAYTIASNAPNIEQLKAALLHVDNLLWLRCGPEVLRWILMTGAAGATCLADQAFFILRSYMITSIIEPEEMDAFLVGVDHLLWVFNRREEEEQVEEVGDGEEEGGSLNVEWVEDVFRQLM